MKKGFRLLLVLAAVIILALTGCGGSTPSQESASEDTSAAAGKVPETEFKLIDESDIETESKQEEATSEADGDESILESGLDESLSEEDRDETSSEADQDETAETSGFSEESTPNESDTPTEKDELAAYIHEFGHLPSNFITKDEAKDLGWVSKEGNLWEVAPGCSIGGDYYSNYEGTLPKADGRKYYECDVGYEGGYRDARRIVFSNDGLIYYTGDHYETFELLYGEE